MQFNKNDFHSISALICLVISLITFFSVNYLWLFAPYGQSKTGLIRILLLNVLSIGGIVYGKKTLRLDFSKKKK